MGNLVKLDLIMLVKGAENVYRGRYPGFVAWTGVLASQSGPAGFARRLAGWPPSVHVRVRRGQFPDAHVVPDACP
jgi:hypothetical protein